MQNYINQLITDLKTAKKNVPPDPMLGTEASYEEFEAKMFAIETAPDISPKKLFGVGFEELPPAEMLSEQQMEQLIDAITEMWEEFNIGVAFKDNMPVKLQYELVRETFAEDIHYMPGSSFTHDFCSGWCPDCKIIDYCDMWEENWTKQELEESRKKE